MRSYLICLVLFIFMLGVDAVTAAPIGATRTVTGTNKDETIDEDYTTTTDWQSAINITASDSKITVVEGTTITTTGKWANAIENKGSGNIITNMGNLRTTGELSNGIENEGLGSTIVNKGNITSTGRAISSSANKVTIKNEGNLDSLFEGILSTGDDVTIKNTKHIKSGKDGIKALGANINATNFGTIEAETHGIFLSGDNSSGSNSGIIIVDEGENGMYAEVGNNMVLHNTAKGIIKVKADPDEPYATGMVLNNVAGLSKSYSGKMINDGLIEMTGNSAWKFGMDIRVEGESTNNGTIKIVGDSKYNVGMSAEGDLKKIYKIFKLVNTGDIHVSGGQNNHAIDIVSIEGQETIFTNKGFIQASGTNAFAIKSRDGNEIINLLAGSKSNGDIDLGKGNDELNFYIGAMHTGKLDMGTDPDKDGNDKDHDVINIRGSGNQHDCIAVTLQHNGTAEEVNLLNLTGCYNGKSVITVDPTEQAVKATVLSTLTSGIHSIVNKRLNSLSDLYNNTWIDDIYIYRQRDDESGMVEYDQNVIGAMGGYDRSFGIARFGVMGGATKSDIESNSNSFETQTNSYFAGMYAIFNTRIIDIQLSFLAGREDHDNDRIVTDLNHGREVANADFYSTFLSPSLTMSKSFGLTKKLSLRPSAGIIYSVAWYDDYHETGTTQANLFIDDRTLDAVNWNAGLNVAYQATKWCSFEVFGSGSGRYTDDEEITAISEGVAFRIKGNSDHSVHSANVGASLNINLHDRLTANATFQHSEMPGNESKDVITGGINFRF